MQQTHSCPAVAMMVVALSGAVSATEPVAEPPGQQPTKLEGRGWQLVGYQSANGLVEIAANAGVTPFRFEDGQVSGRAGCNQFSGSYTLDGDRLVIGAGMASTMMACPEPLMQQEQAVFAAFEAVTTARQGGERLELLDDTGATRLVLRALPASPLVDNVWMLEAYRHDRQGLVAPMENTQINLDFHDQGTLNGSDGCNRYVSGYVLESGRLRIGPLATTRMACRGPDAVAEQATAYANALSLVSGYRIEGPRLTLIDAEGEVVARFQARSD